MISAGICGYPCIGQEVYTPVQWNRRKYRALHLVSNRKEGKKQGNANIE